MPVSQTSLGAPPCQSLHKLLFQGVSALQASPVLPLAKIDGFHNQAFSRELQDKLLAMFPDASLQNGMMAGLAATINS